MNIIYKHRDAKQKGIYVLKLTLIEFKRQTTVQHGGFYFMVELIEVQCV